MNFFRSEEHVRNWSKYAPDSQDGIISVEKLMGLFSGNYFTRRLDPDWLSHSREYAIEMASDFSDMGPFWQIPRKKK